MLLCISSLSPQILERCLGTAVGKVEGAEKIDGLAHKGKDLYLAFHAEEGRSSEESGVDHVRSLAGPPKAAAEDGARHGVPSPAGPPLLHARPLVRGEGADDVLKRVLVANASCSGPGPASGICLQQLGQEKALLPRAVADEEEGGRFPPREAEAEDEEEAAPHASESGVEAAVVRGDPLRHVPDEGPVRHDPVLASGPERGALLYHRKEAFRIGGVHFGAGGGRPTC